MAVRRAGARPEVRRCLVVALLGLSLLTGLLVVAPVRVDAAVVARPGTQDDGSRAIRTRGAWGTVRSANALGGTYASLNSSGEATLSFTGPGVGWVAPRSPYGGRATVYLDGKRLKTVDLYAPETRFGQLVFEVRGLSTGHHRLRLVRSATRNPAARGGNVMLDALNVYDLTRPRPTAAPRAIATRTGLKVTWPSSPSADVVGYRLRRTTADGRSTVLARLPTTQRVFHDSDVDPGQSYVYRVVAVDLSGNTSTPSRGTAATGPAAAAPVAERYSRCPAATHPVTDAAGLSRALADARPGQVITLAPGVYHGAFVVSVRATARQPLWICGPRDAVIDRWAPTTLGTGLTIEDAAHVVVTGLSLRTMSKAVLVSRSSFVTLSDLAITDIGEEAIHLRANSTDNVVVGNTIRRTGLRTPGYGEGVYIGSDPGSWCSFSACRPDRSDRNAVVDNTLTGVTAEGIEAKAGTSAGIVQGNTIDGAEMTTARSGGWVVIKGNRWSVAGNSGTRAPGHGFTATYSKAAGWGRDNVFLGNDARLDNVRGYGVWVQPGIGNVVGCDNGSIGPRHVSNVDCLE